MPTNKLTDMDCRSAASGAKARKLFDGHGLHLHVTPNGHKGWRWAYRWAGKAQTATLGDYPLVGLADARKERDKLRRLLARGENPRAAKATPPATAPAVETPSIAPPVVGLAAPVAEMTPEDPMLEHVRLATAMLIESVARRSVELLKGEVVPLIEATVQATVAKLAVSQSASGIVKLSKGSGKRSLDPRESQLP